MSLLIRNLAQLATPAGPAPLRARGMRELRVVPDAAILIEGERFAWIGPESDLPAELVSGVDQEIDGEGGTALPGFVDAHTHLPFAGTRESEFNRRLRGASYEEIAASGGGIAATVAATRAADETELTGLVLERTRRMAAWGTTTAEAKSGYGLNLEDELKQLSAVQRAAETSPVRLVPTCLAAHEFPPGIDRNDPGQREAYLQEVVREIMPAAAARQLARFCDVFVERGVFTRAEGELVLREGAKLGLVPRIHADELSDSDAAVLATEVGAASADHLMYVSRRGIDALAESDTVANLLPATSYFLMSSRYAPARELIDRGAIVSLSTDCNPGSSMTESMQMVVQLASLQMKMTVEEALTAATLNAAYSLRISEETGSLEEGKKADLIILDAPNYLHLVYHFGVNLVRAVFRDGRPVAGSRFSVLGSQ
jgi:imidazolonepropionase